MLLGNRLSEADKRRITMLMANNNGGDLRQQLLDSSPFYAQLTKSLVLNRGTGTPTFTRATTATVQNNDGYLVQAISGEARFQGARRVRNLFPSSQGSLVVTNGFTTFGNAAVVSSSAIARDGTASATNWTGTAAGTGRFYCVSGATLGVSSGKTFMFHCWAKGNGTANIAQYDGVSFTYSKVTLTSTYQRFTIVKTHAATADNRAGWFLDNLGSGAGTATDITISEVQWEDITGRTDQTTPSEYVSVGVLSNPWHGAGVDGVKYFDVDISGNPIPLSTLKGYLAEGARTQILATADIRDMTTASWTLGATMTRARTSVGADGAANSATRLTGGAVAATNTCLTTIVAAASSRTYSALVKRVTGTGPVRIIQTGTETDISSQINSTTWTQVKLNASVLNVAIGFKIDTNGDAIDVDFNQFEAGAFASSPIAANGTRNADVLTYPSAGNIDGTKGWCFADVNMSAIVIGSVQNLVMTDTVPIGSGPLYLDTGNTFLVDATAQRSASPALTVTAGVQTKLASTWGGSSCAFSRNGAYSAGTGFDGNLNCSSIISIGIRPVDSNGPPFCTFKNVRIGQRQLSASEMQAVTK